LPILSAFFGIVIKIYHGDHPPPHIHVEYGEFEAQFDIINGRLLAGKLPPRAQKLVKEWLKLRKNEVIKAWKIAERLENPPRIKPLE
jgi:hypothetical protein